MAGHLTTQERRLLTLPVGAHMSLRQQFDMLFSSCGDPWGYQTSWYEYRKRQLLLACLPHEQYRSGFEPGCANGVLTLELAARCAWLLSCDLSPVAVSSARERTCRAPNVRIEVRELPAEWPAQTFDLIVLSEFLGFLTDNAIRQTAHRTNRSLLANGAVALCHWQHPMENGFSSGAHVHSVFNETLCLPHLLCHEEKDFLLDVWTTGAPDAFQ
jgi:SAM-dependent methyltransferase